MAFEGRAVIVTGSSSGFGQDTALLFGTQGASVTIHGQSLERLQQTSKLLNEAGIGDERICIVQGPIEKEDTQQRLIDDTIAKFGRLDVLVNNAGLSHRSDLDPNSLENFDYVMMVNLRSVIALTNLAAPHLEKTQGNIVNISSISAQRAAAHFAYYRLSKIALDHYTRGAALQFAPFGIRVNAVAPGVMLTNFVSRHGAGPDEIDAYAKNYSENCIPMKRLGTIREVTNVIEFLASDRASYVTGSVYNCDGGLVLNTSKRAPPQK